MKRSMILFFSIILIFVISCDSKQVGSAITPDEFREIILTFHNHFDNKDFRSLANMCCDDMFWYSLNGRALKKTELAGFFMPMMSSWKTIHTTVTNLEFNLNDNLGVARYKTQIDILTSSGGTSMKNLHTMILKHSGKEWKIWQHHMTRKN